MPQKIDYDNYDEVVVERIVAGRHVGGRICAAGAAEVVRRLAGAGYSDGQIAHILGFARRSVIRIRQRRQIPTRLPAGSNGHSLPNAVPTRPHKLG